jgi:TonB family protein
VFTLLVYAGLFVISASASYILWGDSPSSPAGATEVDSGTTDATISSVPAPPSRKERAGRRPKRRKKVPNTVSPKRPKPQEKLTPDGGKNGEQGGAKSKRGPTSPKLDSGPSVSRGRAAPSEGRAALEIQGVKMVVKHYAPQIRLCSDRAAKKMPKLAGRVEIRFVVGGNGRVSSGQVIKNTTGHKGLGLCIVHTLKRWQFPRPAAGTATFVYPFDFSLKNRR